MKPFLFVCSVLVPCAVVTVTGCAPRASPARSTAPDSGGAHDGGDSRRDAACTSDAPDAWRAEDDAATRPDAYDDRTPDFQLFLLDPPFSVAPGETAPLRVRIERVGGFDAPVLIDLWGLPSGIFAQARESRVSDDVIEVTLEVDADATPTEESAFAVQAAGLGIRRVVRTTIRIR